MEHALSEYASPDICRIWTPQWNHAIERDWWVRILDWLVCNTSAYDHIDDIDSKVAAYREALTIDIDLDAIMLRELRTKHDVKARIEEFNHLASVAYMLDRGERWDRETHSLELIHWAMTSADVVDNVSLIKINSSMCWLWSLYGQDDGPAAQLIDGLNWLPLRGLQGPVGTQQDLLDLLGDRELIDALNSHLAGHYGFGDRVMTNVGQVYPRSLDLVIGTKVAAALTTSHEPPPHPWYRILRGYLNMIAEYSGDQWSEGDVSTSVIRRVALPGLFLAADCAIRKVEP